MRSRRLSALTLAVAVVVAAPAAGGSPPSPVCRYDPEPRLTREERELRDAIAKRKRWTLPHDRGFVRRVNADPRARRRGLDILDFPMTVREAAYFRLRDRYEGSRHRRRLDAYLRSQPETFGGASLEDDYPRGPYMLVHFTTDLERHRRAIADLFPLRFVLRQVPYSARELERVRDSIDFHELAREGIHLLWASTAPGHVRLEVTTPRTDAPEVVRRLYGPAAIVTVVAATPTFLRCASPQTYRVSGDGRTLHVRYSDSGSVEPRRVEVRESATEVRVGIVSEVPHGGITADRVEYRLSVRLSEPLGDRVVRSIESGRRVRRAG